MFRQSLSTVERLLQFHGSIGTKEADKKQSKDIADYLIQQDWRLFRKTNPKMNEI